MSPAPTKKKAAREVYARSPLEFVAFEIRYPLAPALLQESKLPELQRVFYDWLPLVEPIASIEADIQSLMAAPSPVPMQSTGLRFLGRDRRLSVSVLRNKLVIETTTYPGFEQFRAWIARALEAVKELGAAIPGISRVGLRYIDEIRVAKRISKPSDWKPYIDPRLVGPLHIAGESARPAQYQGLVQFDWAEGHQVVFRFGALDGQAVGNAPLRRHSGEASGPYFLVDIDSFWTASDAVPEFSAPRVLELCDRLHDPAHDLFESAITVKLRDDVLRSKKRGN